MIAFVLVIHKTYNLKSEALLSTPRFVASEDIPQF